jgi:hypothetical protein
MYLTLDSNQFDISIVFITLLEDPCSFEYFVFFLISNRFAKQEWTIQRHGQHWVPNKFEK